MLEPNTILNGRYRILEQVGEGGMATVYRAVDVRLGRTVAVKVLHPEYARDEPFLQRFQQEAEFAASLGAHPNIVDIYDIGEDGPYHYIIMAFVEGRSLKEMIQERAPFSVGEAFAIGAQVASALDFAHKRGLVHRDVKPQNILVTPEGVAKVTDFGIARSVSTSQLTRPGMVIGTVHYFSPEQAQGKVASPASDVYALGIILYEMLTGHLPFDAETPIGVAMQHVHSEPPSPWEYNPDLPARAVGTVMRALEKDPERRYRDAAEFASALSAQATPDLGATTTFSPIPVASAPRQAAPPQRTAVYGQAETVAREPVEYVVEEPARPPRASTLTPPDRKTMWTALGAVLLALGVALAAFFGTRYVLSSGNRPTATATVTPTATATPRPRRHRPTATPYVPVVIQPTSPPLIPPTPTPTPIPPPPTRPPPTPTPTPRPTPTPTPAPPTPTPTPLFPTQPPTPVG